MQASGSASEARGPAPADVELVRRVAAGDHHWAVVATGRRDGSVQATVVTAGVMDHPQGGQPTVAFVARGGTVKLRNLRRDPRATIVFRAGREWVTVEGAVSLIGPDDLPGGYPADAVPGLLREVFTAAGGTHDNWAEYDRVMAEERRTAVFVNMDRVYSNPRRG
ncbi:MAG TPA: TIGR03618 family F420-dependent PPOX class oxidoreductase [Chloroflexota bacterium]|nr:TIGR03618 family F420-dependent PPOX class oxidoreductase [Chloroflexota bacterium]